MATITAGALLIDDGTDRSRWIAAAASIVAALLWMSEQNHIAHVVGE